MRSSYFTPRCKIASSPRSSPYLSLITFLSRSLMKKISLLALAVSSILIAGCGGSETVIPKGALTEEQKAAIKAEDKAVADEESGKSR